MMTYEDRKAIAVAGLGTIVTGWGAAVPLSVLLPLWHSDRI